MYFLCACCISNLTSTDLLIRVYCFIAITKIVHVLACLNDLLCGSVRLIVRRRFVNGLGIYGSVLEYFLLTIYKILCTVLDFILTNAF